MASTITIPDNDTLLVAYVNQKARAGGNTTLPAGQKFAVITLGLAPTITSANYAALASAITAIEGIQGVDLLIDGQAGNPLPDGYTAKLFVEGNLRYIESPVE